MKVIGSCAYAKKILQKKGEFNIFSINSKALYMKNGNHILSLQVEETALSPISLVTNLENFEKLTIDINDKVIYQDGKIYIINKNRDKIIFTFQEKYFYDSNLKALIKNPLSKKYLEKAFSMSKSLIYSKKTQGINQIFLKDIRANTFIIEFIEKKLEEVENLFKNKNYDQGLDVLVASVGLGIGLTPSMDDFLTGFISANMAFCKIEDKIFSSFLGKIKENLKNTSPISGKFLDLAIKGHFNKPLIDFYSFLLENDDLEKLKEEFFKVGSSSGMDAASGIYFYCKNFLD
jgi:hypothetical protein